MLNEKQKTAVLANDTHIFLLAGAGSGKTRVLIERIKRLIDEGVNPNEILAITFTRKAAHEMRQRVNNQLISIHTFHQYCYKALGVKKEEMITENVIFSEDELLKVSIYKNHLLKGYKPRIYDKYQKYLKDNQYKDFDDLLLEYIPLASNHPYKYIFIDEFQDTNPLQYHLLEKMLKEGVSCFAVGDPDQSIYAFRGAEINMIKTYVKAYNARIYELDANYRSDKHIIKYANILIRHNNNRFKKTLKSTSVNDGIFIMEKYKELNYNHILEIINQNKTKKHDIAILYRYHYQVNGLKQYLESHYIFNVNILSMHESKGLEFDSVIIWDMGVMPDVRENKISAIEEERRLLFVAITRARHALFILSNKKSIFYKELLKTKI